MTKKLTFKEAREMLRQQSKDRDEAWARYWARENPPKTLIEAMDDLHEAWAEVKRAVKQALVEDFEFLHNMFRKL